jgi:hypothetical protein
MMVAGDGICLRSNGLPANPGKSAPPPAYAQGAPITSGAQLRTAAGMGPSDNVVLFLPIEPNRPASVLHGMRDALRGGEHWFVVSIHDDDTILLYTRRTLEAVVDDNARWTPATVRIFGVLGPYQALAASGYR